MFWSYLSVTLLMLTGVLLIFIILLQRGRGGGLAGAFGGAGGQSALGTKAGDVFTRITIVLAVFWVFLACVSIYTMRAATNSRIGGLAGSSGAASAAPTPGEAPGEGGPTSPLSGNAGTGAATAGGAASTGDTSKKKAPPAGGTEEAGDTGGPSLGGATGGSTTNASGGQDGAGGAESKPAGEGEKKP